MSRTVLIFCASLAGCAAERGAAVVPPLPAAVTFGTAAVTVHNTSEGVPHEIVRRKNFVIGFGEHALEVDPADGGRIVGFSLHGQSVVVPREESPEAYGSSFWPSPQSDWNWPPPLALDKASWQATVEGKVLVLSSGTDEKLGLSAEQRIFAEPSRGGVVIEHIFRNRAATARRVAPWQNTRVRPRGLTFFPSPGPALPDSPLRLQPQNGIVWFSHDPAAHKQGVKGFSDGAEGWLAHADGDLLFVKVFADVARASQAPKEAEIEIYVDGAGRFVEVEQQGPYAELAPNGSFRWPVRWLLRKLPADLAAVPGNMKLVEYVRALVTAQ